MCTKRFPGRLLFVMVMGIVWAGGVMAQNLVPNPGFESYSSLPDCSSPTSSFSAGLANYWAITTDGSPDYFTTLVGPLTGCLNIAPSPRSGRANVGFAMGNPSNPAYREYVRGGTVHLEAGVKYLVSFHVKRFTGADASDIGIYFSTNPISTAYSLTPTYSRSITAASQYTELTFVYEPTATGNYYYTIGPYNTDPIYDLNYFFVDDVSIQEVQPPLCTIIRDDPTPPGQSISINCGEIINWPAGEEICVDIICDDPLGTDLDLNLAGTSLMTAVCSPYSPPDCNGGGIHFWGESGLRIRLTWEPTCAQAALYPVMATIVNDYGVSVDCWFTIRVVCPCAALPNDCLAWWSFDDMTGPIYNGKYYADDVVGYLYAVTEGNPVLLPPGQNLSSGHVDKAYRFDGVDDYLKVDYNPRLNFGASLPSEPGSGDFTFDAWVRTCSFNESYKPIVNKWSSRTGMVWPPGYEFGITSYNLMLSYADASGVPISFHASALGLMNTAWHHVAVAVDRDQTDGVTFYLDGAPIGVRQNPTSLMQSLDNDFPLLIGGDLTGGLRGYWMDDLDELEIFDRALTDEEIASIYKADTFGKCKERCYVPWSWGFCIDDQFVQMPVFIYNLSGEQHTYSFVSVEAQMCNSDLPIAPQPIQAQLISSGPITIDPGKRGYFVIRVERPSWFTMQGYTACFSVLVENDDWLSRFSCMGSVFDNRDWCIRAIPLEEMPLHAIPFDETGGKFDLAVVNNDSLGGPVGQLDYEIIAVPADHVAFANGEGMDSLCQFISLNGLPPGTPLSGSISLPYLGEDIISINVTFTEHHPLAFYDIVFLADADDNGTMDAMAVVPVQSVLLVDCNENGISDYEDIVMGTSFDVNTNGVPDECERPIVRIEKTHNSYQGHYTMVSLTLENNSLEMGGFDFLIAYDASALAFAEASPGQLLEDCDWEYFTYRHGVEGNCGDACPSGLLRIIAMAETNDGVQKPSCYGPPDTEPHELAKMKFMISDDRTLECQYVPITFFWDDCGDNMISGVDGNDTYIDRAVFGFAGDVIWDEQDDDGFPESARLLHVGAPDLCLNPDPDKPTPLRFIDFVNGGVDIVCADSIDARGDINLNGIPNEIADATVFVNYFICGLDAFTVNPEGQIAASDVNADGIVLSVADLVYLIRVIVGDVSPYNKPSPIVAGMGNRDGVLSIDTELGAAHITCMGDIHPVLLAKQMTLEYAYDEVNDLTRVLVYSMEKGRAFTGEFIQIDGDIVEVDLATYNGGTVRLDSESLPMSYALYQNYPNPFNPTTTITFSLAKGSNVQLDIFNLAGQKVTTLVDEYLTAGMHSCRWNGGDASSGIYFYRVRTDDFTASKKMILLK